MQYTPLSTNYTFFFKTYNFEDRHFQIGKYCVLGLLPFLRDNF